MAEIKKKKIISASDAKKGKTTTKKPVKTSPPKKAKEVVKEVEEDEEEKEIVEASGSSSSAKKKRSSGLRTGAIILWVLAVLFEIGAIYMLNIAESTLAIVAIVLDAICCISGSLLWKKANRITPCKSKNKFVAFIWNQMGVIACLVAFIPLGLFLLLKADKIPPKMKQIIAVIASVAFLGSTAASVDYNPPTPESVAMAEAEAAASGDYDGTVYWTRWGKSYHLDTECSSLSRSTELISGTIEEAFESKRNDPCDFCAGGGDQ